MSERTAEIHKEFEKHVSNANMSLVDLLDYINRLEESDLDNHLASYKVVYEIHSLLEKISKITSELKSRLSYKVIPEIMSARKIESIRYEGRSFVVAHALRASIPEAKREIGFKWLKDNGLEGLLKEGVNPKSLSSALGDFIEETGIEPPEEAITMYKQPYIQMRK